MARAILGGALAVLLAAVGRAGESLPATVPEFGDSVVFEGDAPQFRMEDLRGKMVILLFYQSWCPKCNAWSAGVFRDTARTYGKDRAVALVALKSDESSPSRAAQYLRERADPGPWLIGADRKGRYQQAVMGNTSLYRYAVVAPDGRVVERGYAGGRYVIGGKATHCTGMPELKRKHGEGAAAVLPGKDFPDAFAAAVKAAEVRDFKRALAECAKPRGVVGEKAEALAGEILAAATEGLEAHLKTLKDPEAEGRFEAYRALRRMAEQLEGTEPAKQAASALAEARKDRAIARELAAEADYQKVAEWARKASDPQRAQQLPPLLERFVHLHGGTVFGARAAAELKALRAEE